MKINNRSLLILGLIWAGAGIVASELAGPSVVNSSMTFIGLAGLFIYCVSE